MLKSSHFEGQKNVTQGHRGSKEDKTLVELLPQPLKSAAGAGGAATEAMTVEGLKADDEIVSVSQQTPGGNNLPLLGWSTQVDGGITGIWSADPGAGAVLQLLVRRSYQSS